MKHVSPTSLVHGAVALAAFAGLASAERTRAFTRDNAMQTFDAVTVDSLGVFLIGELERLDPRLNMPLVAYTWGRDIDLRTDVSVGDEVSSFTNSSFAASGGISPNGKSWISKAANQIPGVSVDIGKTANPLTLWGMELSYTLPELDSAIRLGRPIDEQKFNAINLKYQMDVDEQVYIGDSTLGFYGLLNSTAITPQNVANGAGGGSAWSGKTPAEILTDVNTALTNVWAASGWAVTPNRILIPPKQFGQISSQIVSSAGNISVLQYLLQNNIATQNGVGLSILPCKWLIGRGVGGTPGTIDGHDRMVVYTKSQDYVRFPITPLSRTPLENRSLYQITTYYGRLGVVEFVYPETVGYYDGL